MEKQDYYVYLHRRGDNNEVFYVGKGRRCRATSDKKGRSEWWKRIVAKYGFTVEYVEKGLSEESAFDLEIETIKFYRENGHKLCNMTDGGEGSSGYKLRPETLEKHVARVNSPEFKQMIKAAVSRPVICSNGMKFDSCKDAEIWIGKHPSGCKVSTCCRRESKSAGGYVWRFQDDADDLLELLEQGKDAFVEWKCQEHLDKSKPKTVYCSNGMVFASGGEVVRWFKSIGEQTVRSTDVSACCNGRKKKLRNLEFSFENRFSRNGCEDSIMN